MLVQFVSDESSALSSASDPARRLEDETDSLFVFRFLGTAVLLAELHVASIIWQALMPSQHLAEHFTHAHGLQLCSAFALNARRRRSAQSENGAP